MAETTQEGSVVADSNLKGRHITFHQLIAMGLTSMQDIAKALGNVSAEYVSRVRGESKKISPETEVLIESRRISRAQELMDEGMSRPDVSKALEYKDPEGKSNSKQQKRQRKRWSRFN